MAPIKKLIIWAVTLRVCYRFIPGKVFSTLWIRECLGIRTGLDVVAKTETPASSGKPTPVVRTNAVRCIGVHFTENVNCKFMQFTFVMHCLPKNFIKEKVEETKRLRRWHNQLLDDLTENVRYRTLKLEVTDRSVRNNRPLCGELALEEVVDLSQDNYVMKN